MPNQRNSGGRSTRPKRSKRRNRMMMPQQPPQYVANCGVRKVFRFVATAAGTFNITPAKLCALISIGTSATQVTQLFEAALLHRVTVWNGPVTANLTPSQVAIAFPGAALGIAGNDRVVSDISVGATRVARATAKTSPIQQAGQWQPGLTTAAPGTSTLFQIVLNATGAVIDIDVSLRMTPDARIAGNVVTVAAATISELYYMALDNNAGGSGSGSSDLVPDSVLVTTT